MAKAMSLYAFLVFAIILSNCARKGESTRQDRQLAVRRTPLNLVYHNGSVMTEGVNLYVIYYGTWPTTTTSVVESFLQSLGESSTATSEPNLKQWWSVLSQYYDLDGNTVTSNVTLQQTYYDSLQSVGSSFSINSTIDANSIINESGLPVDANGIYIIMTSSDIDVSFWELILHSHFFYLKLTCRNDRSRLLVTIVSTMALLLTSIQSHF